MLSPAAEEQPLPRVAIPPAPHARQGRGLNDGREEVLAKRLAEVKAENDLLGHCLLGAQVGRSGQERGRERMCACAQPAWRMAHFSMHVRL